MSNQLKWSYGLFLFALAAFLVTGVLLDSTLASVPTSTQRLMNFLLIILPTAAGFLLGLLSLTRFPRRMLLSILAILLNGLTALFFTFLINFAG